MNFFVHLKSSSAIELLSICHTKCQMKIFSLLVLSVKIIHFHIKMGKVFTAKHEKRSCDIFVSQLRNITDKQVKGVAKLWNQEENLIACIL